MLPSRFCLLDWKRQTVNDQALGPFFTALYQLRRRVEVSLRASASSRADIQRELSEPFLDLETVHSDCAPVMKLLNHRLVRIAADSAFAE